MTEWPDDLVRDIARRRCAIVIGSGVSRQARGLMGKIPPTWDEFLTSCNSNLPDGPLQHIAEAIKSGDLLHACEWLKSRYGHNWTRRLRDEFSAPQYVPSNVHRNISRLDSRITFSLNFDDILERAADEINNGTIVKKNYYDNDVSEFLRGTERYIIKTHGSLDVPNKLIFTQKDYAAARISASGFYNAFDSALMTHTFLFLGAGYRDPDINLVLENQNFTYSESHPHYFLATKGVNEDLKGSLRTNRNLEVLEYDKQDANHTGFGTAIEELLLAVESERQDLASSSEW